MLNDFCWEIVNENGTSTILQTLLNRSMYPHTFRVEFSNSLRDLYEKGYRKFRRIDLGNIAAVWYKIVIKGEYYNFIVDREMVTSCIF